MCIRSVRKNSSAFHDWRYILLLQVGIAIFFGSAPIHLRAATFTQGQLHAQIRIGQHALYSGKFDEAARIFTSLTTQFPTDPKSYFFLALTHRWLTRIDPDSSTYQHNFERAAEKTITVSKALMEKNDKNREAILYLAAAYGYRAEYYNFLKNRWDRAYDDAVNMREYLEKADNAAVSNSDAQLGYGLYNYYADKYKGKIGWWRFLLSLPKGDKEKGLKLLHDVLENGEYLQVEAWYFLIDIYKNDEGKEQEAIRLCEQLQQTYPDHPFFRVLLAGIYHRTQDWNNSLRIAKEILKQAKTNAYYSPYLVYQATYLSGESSFYLGSYQEALQDFNDIITAHPEDPAYLLPWSHLRRGTIYELLGNNADAAREYQAVLTLDNVLHVHDMAKAMLKNQQKTPQK